MIKLYINGKSGKMGTVLNKLISKDNNFSTSVNIDSADVVIDFSHPESTKKVIQESLKKNKPLVIGTTGLNKEILEDINNASKILNRCFDNLVYLATMCDLDDVHNSELPDVTKFL